MPGIRRARRKTEDIDGVIKALEGSAYERKRSCVQAKHRKSGSRT